MQENFIPSHTDTSQSELPMSSPSINQRPTRKWAILFIVCTLILFIPLLLFTLYKPKPLPIQNSQVTRAKPTLSSQPENIIPVIAGKTITIIAQEPTPTSSPVEHISPSVVISTPSPTTKQLSLPENYGAILYRFPLPSGITSHANINITTDIDFGEHASFQLKDPRGNSVQLPLFNTDNKEEIEKEVATELAGKSFVERIGKSVYVYKLLAADQALSPLEGVWELEVIAQGGIQIVFGYISL